MHTRILGALVRPRFLVRASISARGLRPRCACACWRRADRRDRRGGWPAVSYPTPITYDGFNSCAGEFFTGTGNAHFLTSENVSTSGVLQSHVNVRIDGPQAVAALSGKKYVVQDTFNHEFVFSKADEDTFDITAHFVRVGEDGSLIPGDDFYEYLPTHITTNASGTVTAFSVRTSDAPCQ
jgi:hypothetical protein